MDRNRVAGRLSLKGSSTSTPKRTTKRKRTLRQAMSQPRLAQKPYQARLKSRLRENQMIAKARLAGHRLTRAEKLAAGIRPKRDDKPDPWKTLTPSEQKRILANSRAHERRQQLMGIPEAWFYGPVAVLERGVAFDGRLGTGTGRV